MSSTYSKNKKELAGVKVISSKEAFEKRNKKYVLSAEKSFIGKVEMAMPNIVLKTNKKLGKTGFVEDVSSLPKRTKEELVNHFYDDKGNRNKNQVAYLIRTDKKTKK